jgi:hypothetical protein
VPLKGSNHHPVTFYLYGSRNPQVIIFSSAHQEKYIDYQRLSMALMHIHLLQAGSGASSNNPRRRIGATTNIPTTMSASSMAMDAREWVPSRAA